MITKTLTTANIIQDLQKISSGTITDSMNGSNITTFRIGGPLEVFVEPQTEEEVRQIVLYASHHSIPLHVVGNGSNLLILDGGIKGIVLSLKKIKFIKQEQNHLVVGAGETLPSLSIRCIKLGLTGLEWSNGIPGTVGGAVVMNAGAFGGMMQDVVEEVYGFNKRGEKIVLKNHELGFGYRKSILQNNEFIITSVKLRLRSGDCEKIKETIKKIAAIRDATQPKGKKCAGSIFAIPNIYEIGNKNFKWRIMRKIFSLLNKPELFIPYMIEKYNLPRRSGGAMLEYNNFNWISNVDNATASDVLNLSEQVRKILEHELKIKLNYEIRIVGKEK